jgi:hypothetical protein
VVTVGRRQRRAHVAADLQPPGPLVGLWDVEVDQQVVQAERGDVVAQRLQRHAVVAGRQLQLLHGDPIGRHG